MVSNSGSGSLRVSVAAKADAAGFFDHARRSSGFRCSRSRRTALAADCTANKVFRLRATRATEALQRGATLAQALRTMDDSGEFGWRLTNAFHARGGFLQALAGWHESLDAKAFQQEQAAAHGITSALVVWNGLFVGAIVISVFMCLVSFINAAVLW